MVKRLPASTRTMSEVECAYLGALIDGEGTVARLFLYSIKAQRW